MLESAPPEDAIVVALEGEMLFCHNSLPQLQDEPGALEEGSFLVLVPGFLSREERIYNNLMSDLVVKAKNGEDPTLPESFLNPEAADWFTGRTGVVAQILIPNSVRAGQQLQLSRKSLIAAATASGIAAYRAQEGRLPSSLDQLAQAGIPFTSDGKLIEAMEYKVDGDSATLKVRVQGPTSEIVPPSAAEWDHPWVEITNQDYLFKFHK